MSVKQLFDLGGRVAIVTGGSRGLGLQMAAALGEMGARVMLVARKADELEEAKQQLAGQGIEAATCVADMTDRAAASQVVDATLAAFGGLDILVNNAGATWGAPAEDFPDEAWDRCMKLNVDAPFFLSREAAKRVFIPKGAGNIINISSIAGLSGPPPASGMNTVAYNTSKAALINLTRALASEWGPRGIRVNAICPGFFPTKMSTGLLDKMGKLVIAGTPLQRLGDDEDLMGLAVYLASDASRHVTGQAIAVDGGMSVC